LTPVAAASNWALEFELEWGMTVFSIINHTAAVCILSLFMKGFTREDTFWIFKK